MSRIARASGTVAGDLAQAGERVLGHLHVVDEDDVRLVRGQRRGHALAAVDEADDLEPRRLAQGQADGLHDQRVVGHDDEALHG